MTERALSAPPMAAATESTEVFRTGTWRFERPVFVGRTAPCSEACPLGQDIPRIMALHQEGLHEEALAMILEENPFPSLCGRICFAPCERVCNRGRFDQAVSIRDLERFASECILDEAFNKPLRSIRGFRLAVLGAGAAGISCAWFLSRLGHRVTLLEPSDRLAIFQEMDGRIPESVMEQEVGRLVALGVDMVTGFSPGPEPMGAFSTSYDGVYLTSPLPGETQWIDTPGHPDRLFTLQDLRQARKTGKVGRLAGMVAIAGCGPGALEAARTVRELGGCPEVLCGSSRNDLGALPGDLDALEADGITIRFESGMRGLSEENDRLRVLLGGPPHSDLTMEPVSSEDLETDAVVFVPGVKGAQTGWISRVLDGGLTVVQEPALLPAGGLPASDRSRGLARDLAAGKRAALTLDLSLLRRSLDLLDHASVGRLGAFSAAAYAHLHDRGTERRRDDVVRYEDLNTACFQASPRAILAEGKTLTPDQARDSARRCFNCGMCTFCGACDDYCPDVSIHIDRQHRTRTLDYDHCKGCGICARECPRGAIVMEKEDASIIGRR